MPVRYHYLFGTWYIENMGFAPVVTDNFHLDWSCEILKHAKLEHLETIIKNQLKDMLLFVCLLMRTRD